LLKKTPNRKTSLYLQFWNLRQICITIGNRYTRIPGQSINLRLDKTIGILGMINSAENCDTKKCITGPNSKRNLCMFKKRKIGKNKIWLLWHIRRYSRQKIVNTYLCLWTIMKIYDITIKVCMVLSETEFRLW